MLFISWMPCSDPAASGLWSRRREPWSVVEASTRRPTKSGRAAAAALAADTREDGAAREAFLAADASVRDVRARATTLVKDVTGDRNWTDVNYVFPTFVIEHMPIGLVGLIIAAIFAAAMSSIAAELNSLATASVIDIYKRLLKTEAPDAHYLMASKIATGLWGVFACVMAVYAARLGSLIEVVNRFGLYFYGSLLGVFILALAVKPANGHGAFVGLAGTTAVGDVATNLSISYLWLNVVGAVAVTVVGWLVSLVTPSTRPVAHR